MTLEEILRSAIQKNASDVHLKVGVMPVIRVHGILRPLDMQAPAMKQEELASMARQVMTEEQWNQFQKGGEIDLSYGIPGLSRFRLNVFHQRGSVRMVIRSVPHNIPSYADLNLPATIARLSQLERGLVLLTGVAGSGKSSTLAAIVNDINNNHNKHILTIEDPIEFLIRDKKSLITQREIGVDTQSFADALRSGLRQDPDVILIGEMRDRETIEIAMMAAETGHLVLSTLHTVDAGETINRILSYFEASRQAQMRLQIGAVLQAVISQRLCRRKDGTGFVPSIEILFNNARIRELIEDPQKTGELRDVIEKSKSAWGMQSFDQSLMELLDSDQITLDEALLHSTKPEDFRVRIQGIMTMDGKKWSREQHAGKLAGDWASAPELQLTTTSSDIKKKKKA